MPAPAATTQPFGLHLDVDPAGRTLVVHLWGQIDVTSSPLLHEAGRAGIAAGCRRVVVDAAGVTFLDAAGLAAMRRALDSGGAAPPLRVRNPSAPVVRLLELTGCGALVDGG
jgi:anti-anti-sigma factor